MRFSPYMFRSTSNIYAFENFLSNVAAVPTLLKKDQLRQQQPRTRACVTRGGMAAVGPDGDGDGACEVSIYLPIRRSLPKVGRNEPCTAAVGKNIRTAALALRNGALEQVYGFNKSLSCFRSVTGALHVKFSQT